MMLGVVFAVSIAAQCAAASSAVQIEQQRSRFVYAQEFRGTFDRHVEALSNIRRAFVRADGTEPLVVGIYPDDPDATGMENVRWQLAAVLGEQRPDETIAAFRRRMQRARPQQQRDYRPQMLQAEEAAVLRSTIANSRQDGLAMLSWLACSNYVQIGPTRMEYLSSSGGLEAPVRIVVPVRPRVWRGPR